MLFRNFIFSKSRPRHFPYLIDPQLHAKFKKITNEWSLRFQRRTDGRTDEWMDGLKDGPTDGPTDKGRLLWSPLDKPGVHGMLLHHQQQKEHYPRQKF